MAVVVFGLRGVAEDGIDTAAGYATVVLNIARASGDKDLVARIEKLLYVMRAVNLLKTAESLEQANKAVPEIRVLACQMASAAPEELRGAIEKYFGRACMPI